jgi:signal transduction histidine kinase
MPTGPTTSNPRAKSRRLRDTALRAIGIPLLGILVPRLTGTLGRLSPSDAMYWVGTVSFIGLSFVLWMGNRALLYHLRTRLEWIDRPLAKLALILGATAAYTLAVSTAALALWYAADAHPGLDWRGLGLNLALILPLVWGVTHIYETLLLINDRLEDRLDLERTERARLQAELNVLRNQLTPHFLFNSLNTLGVLIEENPRTARAFNKDLAAVCRYLLAQVHRDLVPLYQELDFFHSCLGLARHRFPDSLRIDLRGFDSVSALMIPPAALQLLLENALKHNSFSAAQPLRISVELAADRVVFTNTLHARPNGSLNGSHSTGYGLRSLRERFQLFSSGTIAVEHGQGAFTVTLPLVRV